MKVSLYQATEKLLYNYKQMLGEIKNIELEIKHIEYLGCGSISYSEKSSPTNAVQIIT